MPFLLLLAVVALLALVFAMPFFTIWSLNALFGLAIPVTVKTYFSALWLAAVVGGARGFQHNKS